MIGSFRGKSRKNQLNSLLRVVDWQENARISL
jgi:hypothetical protein